MAGVDPGRSSANPGPGPTRTPEQVWNTFAGAGAHPPIVVGDTAYVASDTESVVAIALADGTERWRFPISAGTDTPTQKTMSIEGGKSYELSFQMDADAAKLATVN